MTEITATIVKQVAEQVSQERLLQTAIQLVEIPSPTRDGAKVANCLADILQQEDFP